MDAKDVRNLVVETHYKLYYQALVKLLSFKHSSVHDAEDIVQGAYTRALQYFNSWDGEKFTFEAWFGGILINEEKDFISRERRQGMSRPDQRVSMYEEDEDGDLVLTKAAESLESDDDLLEVYQDIGYIRRQILKYPHNQSKLLLLYFVYQYSMAEVASVTGTDYKVVDNLVHRFKRSMLK